MSRLFPVSFLTKYADVPFLEGVLQIEDLKTFFPGSQFVPTVGTT